MMTRNLTILENEGTGLMNRTERAKEIFNEEIRALELTRDSLGEDFEQLVDLVLGCKGKVIITGMGKPGHIGTKIAASLASLGTPSFYMHPGEAMHGDLGMVEKTDLVIILSYSGESDEIRTIIPTLKETGGVIFGITGNPASTLARAADHSIVFPKFAEADRLGLAPTTSTTALLALGDALALVASEERGWTRQDFGIHHPAGSLGKKILTKVLSLAKTGDKNAVVDSSAPLSDVIREFSAKGLRSVTVTENGIIRGIITEKKISDLLGFGADIYTEKAGAHAVSYTTVSPSDTALHAAEIMKEKGIPSIPVTDGEKPVGTILLEDIVKFGIVV